MAIDNSSSPAAKRSDLLCVLGMHRSGTSAVTQFLHRLGAATAPQLLDAMDGVNQEGFWEDQYIVDMNERLLAARGSRWYDCCGELDAQNGLAESQIHREAISYFKENYATKTLAVVKDPRFCRLLPFWLDVWKAVDVNPLFIHVVRHPFAVAKSLQKRDKIPAEYGIALWLLHTLEAMRQASAYPGLVVIYDAFIQHPLELAEALVSRYRVAALSGAVNSWSEAVDIAVRRDLRHNDNSIDHPLGLRELHIFAVSLYEAISSLAYGQMDRIQVEQWYFELQQILGRYSDEMAMLQRLCAELMNLSADNVRIGEMHSTALTVIQVRDANIQEQNTLIAERNQLINELTRLKFWRLIPRVLRKVRKA